MGEGIVSRRRLFAEFGECSSGGRALHSEANKIMVRSRSIDSFFSKRLPALTNRVENAYRAGSEAASFRDMSVQQLHLAPKIYFLHIAADYYRSEGLSRSQFDIHQDARLCARRFCARLSSKVTNFAIVNQTYKLVLSGVLQMSEQQMSEQRKNDIQSCIQSIVDGAKAQLASGRAAYATKARAIFGLTKWARLELAKECGVAGLFAGTFGENRPADYWDMVGQLNKQLRTLLDERFPITLGDSTNSYVFEPLVSSASVEISREDMFARDEQLSEVLKTVMANVDCILRHILSQTPDIGGANKSQVRTGLQQKVCREIYPRAMQVFVDEIKSKPCFDKDEISCHLSDTFETMPSQSRELDLHEPLADDIRLCVSTIRGAILLRIDKQVEAHLAVWFA